jgi:2-keto-4-pentenoate hydratase/2-oxohepta-3-ene-1,7-dioic acid hydratase in catechol pathway
MKLATFQHNGMQRPGVVVDEHVFELPFTSMLELVRGGAKALETAHEVAARATPSRGFALDAVELLAPIPVPAKNVFCVGRNYKRHIEEGARARGVAPDYPKVPEFFSKPPTAVIGTRADILLPPVTAKLDYEVELAFVVGRSGRDISRADAPKHIFGFTIVNDVTARDLQRAHGQWFKGKALDASCPMGPFIVTAEEFDVNAEHRIWLTVNGELRQDALIADMVFDCAQILAELSAGLTVEAGDIISTGTPSGVGLGLEPQVWLKDGDVIEAGIDGIGSIVNTVRAVRARATG